MLALKNKMGRSKIYRFNKMLKSIKVKRTIKLPNQKSQVINSTSLKKITLITKSLTIWTISKVTLSEQ